MPNVVRMVELLPEEREMLGVNVVHADQSDGETELAAVNRSLASHGEEVAEWPAFEDEGGTFTPCAGPQCVAAGSSSPRPAA